NDVAATASGRVWTVGFSIDQYGAFHGLTARRKGSRWTSIPPADPPGDGYDPMLNGVTAVAPNDVWAVGTYYNGGSALLTLAAHADAGAWTAVSSENPGGTDYYAANVFDAVAAISPTDVRAVGYWHLDDYYNDPPHALIESWCP